MNRIARVRIISPAHTATLCSTSIIPTSKFSPNFDLPPPHTISVQTYTIVSHLLELSQHTNDWINNRSFPSHSSSSIPLLPFSPLPPSFSHPLLSSVRPPLYSIALRSVDITYLRITHTHTYSTYIHTQLCTYFLCRNDTAYR